MKKVNLPKIRVVAQRLALSDLANAQAHVDGLGDEASKADYIRRNGAKWSAIKENLWNIGDLKCWYSEKHVELGLAEVEHFRPKLRVTGVNHPGYMWEAFRWQNYRVSHPLVNKRITDYQTGKLVGKGCYFPLQEGCPRATSLAEQNDEIQVLLDPTIASDCSLIEFDSSSGAAIPKYKKEDDEWLFKRADESIDFYYQNEGSWVAQREDIMKAVSSICDRLVNLKKKANFDQDEYDQAIDELAEYLDQYSDFTSAAEQVYREKAFGI